MNSKNVCSHNKMKVISPSSRLKLLQLSSFHFFLALGLRLFIPRLAGGDKTLQNPIHVGIPSLFHKLDELMLVDPSNKLLNSK